MYKNSIVLGLAAGVLILAPMLASAQIMTAAATPAPTVCLPILRQLVKGSSGADVTLLQQFLAAQGVYTGPVTGYFGPMTEAALQQWQTQQDIVSNGSAHTTGWGAVGPRTRFIIQGRCAPADDLSSLPRTGDAPLSVTFTISMDSVPTNSTFALVYGDGTSDSVYPSVGTTTMTHVYSANGNYISSLIQTDSRTSATTTLGRSVTYVGPITATKAPQIYRLVAPSILKVGHKGAWRIATTLPGGDTTFSVIWGDEGSNGGPTTATSTSNHAGTFIHTYTYAGTFTPRFTATNSQGSTSVVYPIVVFSK